MQTVATSLQTLNLEGLYKAPLHEDPFEYTIVTDTLNEKMKEALLADFPLIEHSGSFPLATVSYGPAFQQLVDELLGPEFEQAVSQKFNLDLSRYKTMITVRGRCDQSDGRIHPDSRDKIITVLLYLNDGWPHEGGRLRLLRSKTSLQDYVAEIPPVFGTMLLFRRCDHSFHGHETFQGKRLSVQLNWVRNSRYKRIQNFRHNVSAWLKRATGLWAGK